MSHMTEQQRAFLRDSKKSDLKRMARHAIVARQDLDEFMSHVAHDWDELNSEELQILGALIDDFLRDVDKTSG